MAGRLLAEFRREHATTADASTHAATPSPSAPRPHTPPPHTPWPVAPVIATSPVAPDTLAQFPLASDAARVLTRRELETLQYVADGLSNKEIGVRLSITEGTVKNHVHNALEKLQLENRIQAAAYVVRHGLGARMAGN
jgi:DNA-binding CsgD family transcriptional regulator